jgi:uncharacterized protein YaiL (DUF2058 family)
MKYIITEQQLKELIKFQKINEGITHEDGKLSINGNKYQVSVKGIDVDVDDVKKLSNGSFNITISKSIVSRTENLSRDRADNIVREVPKPRIVSKAEGKPTITLTKIS